MHLFLHRRVNDWTGGGAHEFYRWWSVNNVVLQEAREERLSYRGAWFRCPVNRSATSGRLPLTAIAGSRVLPRPIHHTKVAELSCSRAGDQFLAGASGLTRPQF